MDFDDYNFDDFEHKKQPVNIPPGVILAGCGSIFFIFLLLFICSSSGDVSKIPLSPNEYISVIEATPVEISTEKPVEIIEENNTPAPTRAPAVPVKTKIEELRNERPLKRAVNVPAQYRTDMETLVKYLVKGMNNDFEKAKVLHDWIALNISYDTDMYFSGNFGPMDSDSVFERRTGVCAGFSNLYQKFCDIAGIKCVTIGGSAKRGPHAWNAVHIKGKWYLIDVTWDTGPVDDKTRTFIRDYSTGFLFSNPAYFIYSHFPEEEKWQLLKNPLTKDQFMALVEANDRFFTLSLELLSSKNYYHKVQGEFEAKIKVPQGVLLMAGIEKDGQKYDNYTLVQRDGEVYIIKARFPDSGIDYKLRIFGKKREDKGEYCGVLSYKVQSSKKNPSFPETYSTFGEHDCFLYSPLEGNLKKGSDVHFKCLIRDVEEVTVITGGKWIPLEKTNGDIYEGTVTLSEGTDCSINVRIPGNSQYWGIVTYNIIP